MLTYLREFLIMAITKSFLFFASIACVITHTIQQTCYRVRPAQPKPVPTYLPPKPKSVEYIPTCTQPVVDENIVLLQVLSSLHPQPVKKPCVLNSNNIIDKLIDALIVTAAKNKKPSAPLIDIQLLQSLLKNQASKSASTTPASKSAPTTTSATNSTPTTPASTISPPPATSETPTAQEPATGSTDTISAVTSPIEGVITPVTDLVTDLVGGIL